MFHSTQLCQNDFASGVCGVFTYFFRIIVFDTSKKTPMCFYARLSSFTETSWAHIFNAKTCAGDPNDIAALGDSH